MKKLVFLSLAALLLFVHEGMAANVKAVFVAEHFQIQVFIDGRLVNNRPAQSVYINGTPGRHRVQIKAFNKFGQLSFVHNDLIQVMPNTQNRFLLQTHPKGGSRLLQESSRIPVRATVPQGPKPIRHYVPKIAELSDQEFEDLMDAVYYQPTDQDRMVVAKKSIHNRQLFAEDVREVMYLFEYENSRLEFAKFAYTRVIDPRNYDVVYEAFSYDASIHQLENYIARIR